MTEKVFLSQRNLLTLLSKLDRQVAGEVTACTITKNDNVHSIYPQTMPSCCIHATEAEDSFLGGLTALINISRASLEELYVQLCGVKGGTITITTGDDVIEVTSVRDDVYYAERVAGPVLWSDDPGYQSMVQ